MIQIACLIAFFGLLVAAYFAGRKQTPDGELQRNRADAFAKNAK